MIIVRSTAEYQFFQGDPEAKANFLKGIGDAPVYEHHKLKILGQPLTGWSHPVQNHITSLEKEFLGVLNSPALGPADYLNQARARSELDRIRLIRLAYAYNVCNQDIDLAEWQSLNRNLFGEPDEFLLELALNADRPSFWMDDSWLNRELLPIYDRLFGKVKHLIGSPGELIHWRDVVARYNEAFSALGYSECIAAAFNRTLFETIGTLVVVPAMKDDKVFSFGTAWRMFCHEATHAITCANTKRLDIPITAHYEGVQEGLAILGEAYSSASFWRMSPGIKRARWRYIMAGASSGLLRPRRTIRETFDLVCDLYMHEQFRRYEPYTESSENDAAIQMYPHLENAYRAIAIPSRPDCYYAKLQIYWSGLISLLEFLRQTSSETSLTDKLKWAFIGKYNFTNAEEARIVMNLVDAQAVAQLPSSQLLTGIE